MTDQERIRLLIEYVQHVMQNAPLDSPRYIRGKQVLNEVISKQKSEENEQENRREWLEERIAIMIADGGLTEFQAKQACQKLLQCRKTQKEFDYEISSTY